ncbi:MAG: tetratricopeptide repeat protein [Candidatus Blackburnbacteria bacterium]|nr:tetratricopeptide repeat protein [Candidatus Blackburnbacteria bacterium]
MDLLNTITRKEFTPIAVFLIIVLGMFSFINMLGNNFVWDDEEMVVNNFPFFKLENIPHLFTQATFFSGGEALSGWFYRPIVMLLFLLITVFFGQAPFGFHFIQLVLHITNAVLLFFIFSDVFGKKKKKLAKPLALILSLIFVVHPAHVESVSYISSMAEPLYTLFLLGMFLLLIKKTAPQLNIRIGIIVLLFFTLALLTKEGAIVFLPLAGLYIFLFGEKDKLAFWSKYLFSGLALYLFGRLVFFGIPFQKPNFLSPIANATFYERILTAPYSLFVFLRTFFFPKELSVSQHFVVKETLDTRFLLGVIAMLLTAVILLYLLKKRNDILPGLKSRVTPLKEDVVSASIHPRTKVYGFLEASYKIGTFFIFWFFAFVFLVLNILFPLDMTFAERWLYFSMIGLLGFIGSVLLLFQNIIIRYFKFVAIIGLFIAVFMSVRAIIRNNDWRDGFTLYSRDIKISKNSFDLENNLGVELFRKNELEKAKTHFERSIGLQPNWTISLNNLGAVYNKLGDAGKAELYYKKAIEKDDYYLAYENLALLLIKESGSESELSFFQGAVSKFPRNSKINLANAIFHYRLGNRDQALRFATRAVQLDPSSQNKFIYQTILSERELKLEEE